MEYQKIINLLGNALATVGEKEPKYTTKNR